MRKLIITIFITLVCVSRSINLEADTIVTDGLVSYWTFDKHDVNKNIAEDAWGENDVVMRGNPKIVSGYLGQGIKLDGLDDYVVLANAGNFSKQLAPFTFEVWFKTTYNKTWTAIYRVVEEFCNRVNAGKGICINAGIDDLPGIDIISKRDYIVFQQHRKRENGACSDSARVFKSSVSDGKWHHLVFVSGEITTDSFGNEIVKSVFYIDLEPITVGISREQTPDENVPYTIPVYLGAVNQDGAAHSIFDGIMDEVRVYNRGLSYEEVIQNNQSRIGLGIEPNGKLSTVWAELKR